MSYRLGSLQVTKWQLALLIGTPVAIGVGIYLFNNTNTSNKPESATDRKKNLAPKDKSQTISIDDGSDDKDLERKKKQAELENEKLSPLKEATTFKNEGNICYRNGKFDEAISFYDKAIAKCPEKNRTDLAIFYQNRAAAYEMLKKWSRVKEDCTRSLEFNPRYAKAYFRRAKANEATNDMVECLNDATATCILEMFQNNSSIMYVDRILKLTGRNDAERGMKTHEPLLPSSNFIQTYLRSFVADPLQEMVLPPNPTIESKRGFVRAKEALDQGLYDEIISACTEEIESSESESQYKSEALLLRGTFNMLSTRFNEAQQDLDAVIANDDVDVSLRTYAYIKRASLYMQLDKKDLSLNDFDSAEKLQPENPDIYHQRAQIYLMLDQLPDALREFEKAVKFAPNHAMAYVQKCYAVYRLSLLSQDQMRLMMVMNEFKNAIEKFPDCVECYSLMAQVLSDQQQFEQADTFYEKAIKMAPSNGSLYVNRGILVLQWKGDIVGATQMLKQALKADDKCELAYETLGTLEVQQGKLDEAVELFEKAIKVAKSQSEMAHLYALRNAAIAQKNVSEKLGINMSALSAMAQAGVNPSSA